mmetsp:Transcript_129714/g.375700  ORF Transcript_129714/g.375700 Transcript_129714/m.375700 type:complete len:206 (+) Transcript_129714:452-1069(+)
MALETSAPSACGSAPADSGVATSAPAAGASPAVEEALEVDTAMCWRTKRLPEGDAAGRIGGAGTFASEHVGVAPAGVAPSLDAEAAALPLPGDTRGSPDWPPSDRAAFNRSSSVKIRSECRRVSPRPGVGGCAGGGFPACCCSGEQTQPSPGGAVDVRCDDRCGAATGEAARSEAASSATPRAVSKEEAQSCAGLAFRYCRTKFR